MDAEYAGGAYPKKRKSDAHQFDTVKSHDRSETYCWTPKLNREES